MNARRQNRYPPGRGRRHGAAGFTLIELLAVIAIIGILLSVAVLGFNTFGRGVRLKTAARLIQQHLDGARELAMTRQGVYGVWFKSNANARDEIYMYWRPASGSVQVVGNKVELPVGIEYGADQPVGASMPPTQGLDFRPTGRAEAYSGGSLTFKIHDADADPAREREFTVNPVTGHTDVKVP